MKDAVSFISGRENVTAICCFCEEIQDPQDILDSLQAIITPEEETIIFTDLFGGSVNRTVSQLLQTQPNLHVVTGVNLATILEFICTEGDTAITLENAIQAGKDDIRYMNSTIRR
ncbi:MAG: fructoselysine/glucoselysine system component [Chloroflexota bacterium]|nr:fructoselysine/glucoselysine system component [Chloroflexota bacterium]